METYFLYIHIVFFFSFKSYYVVWKLLKKNEELPGYSKFKSYYVVWKLGFLIRKRKKS